MLRILLPVDGSEAADRAAEHLLCLARSGVPIEAILLNVEPEIVDWQTHGLAREAMLRHRDDLGRRATENARGRLDAAGITHALHIEIGDPARTIAEFARAHRCDLIVMGTRGMGALPGLLLGSVANKVIHLADVPVTLVK